MRPQILIKHSTKSERRLIEVFKELRIPFKHRWLLLGYEVDFLIGNIIIEVDGRKKQSVEKNKTLTEAGYDVIRISNLATKERSHIKLFITKIYVNRFSR